MGVKSGGAEEWHVMHGINTNRMFKAFHRGVELLQGSDSFDREKTLVSQSKGLSLERLELRG